MALLYGAAAHPHSGEILSTPYRHYRTIEERIESKLAELGDDATPEDRARVRAEQYRIGDRAPVAGYDCTFSPAKSVSALWALAPAEQRAAIEEAHDRAVDAAFGWLEERALHTRAGRDGVRHLDAEGFVVARFRHRTNRNGDPQLHTHCAVANRVWSTTEGRWRALDGQGLYRERAGADAVYMAAIEHELTERLGVAFERRGEVREIASVPAPLVERWSSRRAEVLAALRRAQRRAGSGGDAEGTLRRAAIGGAADAGAEGQGRPSRSARALDRRSWRRSASTGRRCQQRPPSPVRLVSSIGTSRSPVRSTSCRRARAQWSYSHLTKAIARARRSGAHLRRAARRSPTKRSARHGSSSCRWPMSVTWRRCGGRDGESVYRDPQRDGSPRSR